jgi:lysozyme
LRDVQKERYKMRSINAKSKELIQSFERKRLTAYHGAADAPGIYTIGWGHVITGHEVPDIFKPGDTQSTVTITDAMADLLFDSDIAKFINGVTLRLPAEHLAKLSDDQFGAIISFVYNIGLGNFSKSTLRSRLNEGDIAGAARFFGSFVRANGVVVKGLIRRRAAEKALYQGDHGLMQYFLNNSGRDAISKADIYLKST